MRGLFVRALENKKKIMVVYMDDQHELTQRVVKVLNVKDDRLLVYCYFRKQIRTLKIEHVLSAEAVKERVGA